MSTYLDLETDRFYDDERCCEHADWMTIKSEWGHVVSISREYMTSRGIRQVDPEAGICFHAKHLDTVIDALVRLRADLPGLATAAPLGDEEGK